MTKEQLTTQSTEDIYLQKCRASLIASGSAMVLFAVWTVLRLIVQVDSLMSLQGNKEALKPLITVVVILSCIDLILKIYVGLSARVEGLGRSKKRPYLILGIIIAILTFLSLLSMLVEFPAAFKQYGLLEPLITVVVEATVLYAALDMVVSALRVRKLEQVEGRV